MNCFQKLLSSWWRTTFHFEDYRKSQLWIAFKNYYLRDEGQLILFKSLSNSSCELLSKIIIFVMKDNFLSFHSNGNSVVNCFQKLLSSWWRTTRLTFDNYPVMLWIAFKNYYLRDEGQHLFICELKRISCELLSKIIIFVMKDNFSSEVLPIVPVVNCFQKLLSSWWRTTVSENPPEEGTLWIAFKNYYLRDEGQLNIPLIFHPVCCELLSKIIIFVMKDNFPLP